METCTVVAIGASVVLPIMMPCCDPEQFKKDGGFPINTQNLVAPPDQKVHKNRQMVSVQWEKSSAKVGEEVKIEAKFTDHNDGAEVVFKIWKDGADREKEKPVAEIKTVHEGGKAVATWKYVYVHNPDQPLTAKPKFKVEAWSFKCGKKESGTLEVGAEIVIELITSLGDKIKDQDYKIIGPDGTEKSGKTNSEGKINETNLIPGEYKIKILFEKR